MRTDHEQRRSHEGAPKAVTTTATPNSSRPTQRQRVLTMLFANDETCGSTFYRSYLPRFSVWICELRKDGYVITKRPGDRPEHEHEGTGWLYRLEALPYDPTTGGAQ